ncbi:hypothetical protein GJ496_002199 [Pomphorhynchus laevis]|nr:hypothetical protein GJ496_002199 [Pomphorhynchus laevis]
MVSLLIMYGVLVQYAAKIDLSVNIVCMINDTKSTSNDNSSSNTSTGIFNWGGSQRATILAAFFYGYILSEVPGGLMAEKYGSKLVMGLAVIVNSICAWLYSIAALTHVGLFIFLRILVGFGCGLMLPAISHVWSAWAPSTERSILIGVALSGAHLAPIILLPVGGALCVNPESDWKNLFYVVAGLETAWILLWFFLYSNTPMENKIISEKEIAYINQTTNLYIKKNEKSAPWKAMMTSIPCWALFICHTCSNWGLYTLLTEIPSYMKDVLDFDIKSNGLYSSLPYIVIWITTTSSSVIADIVLARNILSRTVIRKIAVILGTFLPGIFLIALGFMKTDQRSIAVALLAVGQGLFGIAWGAGHMCVSNDLAPVHAGVLFGVSNTFATIPGIITPYVTAAIVANGKNTQSQWQIVFAISSVFLFLGGIVFAIYGDARAQRWDSDYPPSFSHLEAYRRRHRATPAAEQQNLRKLLKVTDLGVVISTKSNRRSDHSEFDSRRFRPIECHLSSIKTNGSTTFNNQVKGNSSFNSSLLRTEEEDDALINNSDYKSGKASLMGTCDESSKSSRSGSSNNSNTIEYDSVYGSQDDSSVDDFFENFELLHRIRTDPIWGPRGLIWFNSIFMYNIPICAKRKSNGRCKHRSSLHIYVDPVASERARSIKVQFDMLYA